jgi:helicase
MALVAKHWCESGGKEKTAEKYDCYAFEVGRLRESLIRLLTAMAAIAQKPIELENAKKIDIDTSYAEKVSLLLAMVDGGLDEYAQQLTLIKGIGPKLANS